MPVESGNRAINDGSLGTVMQRAAQRWKPEAMHFTTFDGQRTAFMVFDLPDASDIPSGAFSARLRRACVGMTRLSHLL